jgi:serine/threonine-protein kinase
MAVAGGILSREDADVLAAEARQKQQSPLVLLVERGRMSEQTFASLRAEALGVAARPAQVLDSTVTCALGSETSPPDRFAFPVPAWDRYASVRFLGQGGMGRVFLAHDPRLRRDVAIKFVRGDNPEHVQRLISEARAQARVSHERVCKVHEVGEVEGKVYIAMQYIAGRSLGSMARELTVEEKVLLVRDAAEGLHEAHRAGVIHRDVKPSNIMVERSDDGQLRPYVMDFGLARLAQDDGTTLTGAVLGTPCFMAPEQARGETSTLDRRADVYSLGATLYYLMTGKPPVEGSTMMEVIHNLQTVEPRAPRALNPDVALDLEAIIVKCLEHDRSARYDSARALADDLERFLDSAPVAARAAGTWYRLRKRIVKHRRLVAVVTAALALSLVAVGWGLHARGEAAERERLARRFTEQVEAIEAEARYAALSPRHDLRADHAALRRRMAALDDEIRRAGAIAAGPGHYALGRGYLALGDDAKARAELESAWQHGFREPRAAYALAVVMGRLYHQHMLAAAQLDKELRAVRTREVEQQFRAPALVYLRASAGADGPSSAYVAALVAFYAGALDDALRELDAMGEGRSWLHEAPALRGDILLTRAFQHRDRGEYERARLDLAASRAAYTTATSVGRSVTEVYRSLAALEYATLAIEMYSGGDVVATFERGVAATAHALETMPDDYDTLVLEARFYRSFAEYRSSRATDADALLGKALASAQRAVTIAPARSPARLEVAEAYRQWGEVRQGRNQDPGVQLGQAVAAAEAIPVAARGAAYHTNLGLIFKVWADYQDQVGADSQANRSKTIEAYRRALQLDSKQAATWGNLGITYYERARVPHARDRAGDLAEAIQALDQAEALDPTHALLYLYEGQAYHVMARQQRARGIDAAPTLARAIEALRHGVALRPDLQHFQNALGMVAMEQARDAWDRGADPEPALEQARVAFAKSIELAPGEGFGHDNMGELFVLRARLAHARGDDPRSHLAAGIGWLNEATVRIPTHAGFWAELGAAHALAAAYELERGGDPQVRLREASTAIHHALDNNPRDAKAHAVLGETRGILARLRASRAQPADFEQAATAYQQAIVLAPDDPDYVLALGQLHDRWAAARHARGGDPAPAVQRGLALATQLLAGRPTWAPARLLRASLWLVEAQRASRVERRRELGAKAAAEFTQVLAIHRDLAKAWSRRAAAAQLLAAARPS